MREENDLSNFYQSFSIWNISTKEYTEDYKNKELVFESLEKNAEENMASWEAIYGFLKASMKKIKKSIRTCLKQPT